MGSGSSESTGDSSSTSTSSTSNDTGTETSTTSTGDGDGDGDGDGECGAIVLGDGQGVWDEPGPQIDIPFADIDGWELCFCGKYSANMPTLAEIEQMCDGAHLMMGCREAGDDAFRTFAHAPRADVLKDTGPGNPHFVNSTGWYRFEQGGKGAWGFIQQGDVVDNENGGCDVAPGAGRVCWAVADESLAGGSRCLFDEGLENSDGFERIILHRN